MKCTPSKGQNCLPMRSCDNFVCNSCILDLKIKEIKCNVCETISPQCFRASTISKFPRKAEKNVTSIMLEMLENEMVLEFNHLKCKINED